jgi:hypothetical protein
MSEVKLSWRSAYDPKVLVARLESERSPTNGTYVSAERYPNVGFSPLIDRTLEVVGAAISWPEGLDPETRHQILFHAVASVASKGAIVPEALLKACAAETKSWCNRGWQECVVVSTISVHPGVRLRSCTLERARVQFHGKLNAKWDRSSFQRQLEYVFPAGCHVDYKVVTISLHAPDASIALDNARRILDVRRGMWNWYLNRRSWTQHIGIPTPNNRILWGPITTVHKPDGSPAQDILSYDDEFRNSRSPETLPTLKELLEFERYMTRKMKASKLSGQLEQFIVGYVRTLDHANYLTAFQSLWPVFESLTGGLNGNYEHNFRRMLACYSTSDPTITSFLLQELEHLREFRNTLVHEGRSSAQAWAAVQQLKGHVHAALGVFFGLLSEFPNMQTAYDFLELPRSESELRRQANMLRKALALRCSKEEPTV